MTRARDASPAPNPGQVPTAAPDKASSTTAQPATKLATEPATKPATESDQETNPEATPEPTEPAAARRPSRWFGLTSDGLVAVATWAVLTPLAAVLAHAFDLDPFSVGGVVMAVGVGGIAAAVVLALVLRWRSDVFVGVAIGVYASWMALTMSAALNATPFGYGQLAGDAGRFVAMAMKSMYTWQSSDSFVRGLPTEYPPLYPWVVGHVAQLVDRPAWQLFGDTQIVVMSGTMVVAYVFWRRMVGAGTAFAIVGLSPAVFNQPSKDYEFLALMIFVPWVLATLTDLPRERGGLHWFPAGIIGGLLVLTYQAWFLYSVAGLLVLVGMTLRSATSRKRYLLHVLGAALTAFVVASWYLVPFVRTLLAHGGNRISDLWLSPSIVDHPLALPFFQSAPLALVELLGLLGTVWYVRTRWWARPLLVLLAGTYAYRVVLLVKTAIDNHTWYLQYAETLIAMVLLVAGVLTAAEAAPRLWARLALPPASARRQRDVAVVGVAVLVIWSAMQGWQAWVPGPRGVRDSVRAAGEVNRGTDAHAEPLPDGRLVRFAPPAKYVHTWFPTSEVERVVSAQLGDTARPVVLANDQRLFSFLPYYGYIPPDRLSANTVVRWDDRAAEIARLARITDPGEFAAASQRTAFGPIDVFVLKSGGRTWRWKGVAFSPKVFAQPAFYVEQLSADTVVAVRVRH